MTVVWFVLWFTCVFALMPPKRTARDDFIELGDDRWFCDKCRKTLNDESNLSAHLKTPVHAENVIRVAGGGRCHTPPPILPEPKIDDIADIDVGRSSPLSSPATALNQLPSQDQSNPPSPVLTDDETDALNQEGRSTLLAAPPVEVLNALPCNPADPPSSEVALQSVMPEIIQQADFDLGYDGPVGVSHVRLTVMHLPCPCSSDEL